MANLQRRRGSSSCLRLFIPNAACADEMDFSVATRSILEGIVHHWAVRDELNLEPLNFCLQGVDLQQGPKYLSHIVGVVDVRAEQFKSCLEKAVDQIIADCGDTRDGYYESLTSLLDSYPPSSSTSSSSSSSLPKEGITRDQLLFLLALCSRVALEFVQKGREEELLHCLTWSTEFLCECCPASAWIRSRGGWARAFEHNTPHLGLGTLGIIASLVCIAALLLLKKR